mgnify:CR=1 FL=1
MTSVFPVTTKTDTGTQSSYSKIELSNFTNNLQAATNYSYTKLNSKQLK